MKTNTASTHHLRRLFIVLTISYLLFITITVSKAGTFADSLTSGSFSSTYWTGITTFEGNISTDYSPDGSITASSSGVDIVMPTTLYYHDVDLALNLAGVTGSSEVTGNFQAQVSFQNFSMGSPYYGASSTGTNDGIVMMAEFADGNKIDILDDWESPDINAWGSYNGFSQSSIPEENNGILSMTSTNGTLNFYFDDALVQSYNESSPLTDIYFGITYTGSATFNNFSFTSASAVPEPSTWEMLIGGATSLLMLRRHRRFS